MRFSAAQKAVTYLVALTAIGAIAASPEVPLATVLVALAAVGASWFAEPPRLAVARFTPLWNVATIAFVGYQAVRVGGGGSVILAGIDFLLFVLVNKLFNRRGSRDYQQAYVVSFLMMVAATTLNTGLSYAVAFVAFVVFLTWGLVLLHLRRELEEHHVVAHPPAGGGAIGVERLLASRRIVGPRFLAATAAVALVTLAGSAVIFAAFPRLGFGLFVGLRRGGMAMVGFRDTVELGHHGTLRDNPDVVMRVVLPEGPRPRLRFRGAVFAHYENGVWSHGGALPGQTLTVLPEDGLHIMVRYAWGLPPRFGAREVRRRLYRQHIYLEPLDSTVIFAADRPVAVEVPRSGPGGRPLFTPARGLEEEIRGRKRRTAGVHYVAYSQIERPPPEVLARAVPIRDPRWSRYLALPPSLPRRVRDLARRVTRGAPTVYRKVLAVERFLRRNYRYTTTLEHDPAREPIDEFLFVTRRGHCEYFASAMALMLRAAGVHTRGVNGFAGGQWNAYGRYLAVRQADAHSWVEVLFSNVGWVAFDPTPPAATAAPAAPGPLDRLRQMVDALRLRWFTYVVEYDLRKQVALAARIGRAFRGAGGGRGRAGSFASRHRGALLAAGGLLLAVAVGAWAYRRRRRAGRAPSAGRRPRRGMHPASRLYARALRDLRRAGHPPRPAGMTPAEHARALADKGDPLAPLVAEIARCYYAARFGPGRHAPRELRRLEAAVARLEAALRRREAPRGPPRNHR